MDKGILEWDPDAIERARGECPESPDGKHQWSEKYDRSCGAKLCVVCGAHKGLARCYCGWAADGGDGAAQLRNMGENLDEDY